MTARATNATCPLAGIDRRQHRRAHAIARSELARIVAQTGMEWQVRHYSIPLIDVLATDLPAAVYAHIRYLEEP